MARLSHLPEIVAHRGAGRTAVDPLPHRAHRPAAPPENTLPALEVGWRWADACELDVRLTRDGRLVAIHDPTTGRLCDRDVEVAGTDLAELKALDAGRAAGDPWRGTRLATLEEALDRQPADRRLWVELKPGPGIVEPLVALDARRPLDPRQVVFLSFDLDTIARLKQDRPAFACYLAVRFALRPSGWAARIRRADVADPRRLASREAWLEPGDADAPARLFDRLAELVAKPGELADGGAAVPLDGLDVSREPPPGFFEAMREAGVAWGAWGVDDGSAAVRLAAHGAIQLTTDGPADLRHALAVAAGA